MFRHQNLLLEKGLLYGKDIVTENVWKMDYLNITFTEKTKYIHETALYHTPFHCP